MTSRRKLIVAASVAALAIWSTTFYAGAAQDGQERVAHSDGTGTLRVGDEQFKISAAVVKLLPNRKAELTIVSDITVFLVATWSNHADSPQEFDLDMTDADARGGLHGTGKLSLSDDGKSVKRLTLKGISRTTKRPVEAQFEGK